MKYTYWGLTLDKKKDYYILETAFEDGNWTGGQKGEKIYYLDDVYVWIGMNFKPIAVFKSKEEMVLKFISLYGTNYKMTQ